MANSEETATFGIVAEDGVSAPVDSASTALKNLKREIDSDNQALGAMNRAMKQLESATDPNREAIDALGSQMGQLKEKIAESNAEFIKLGGSFRKPIKGPRPPKPEPLPKVDPPVTPPVTDAVDQLKAAIGMLPAPIQSAIGKFQSLSSMGGAAALRMAGLAGAIVLVVGALYKLTTALGQAVVGMTKFAITSANTRRSELLHLEGLTRIRTAMSITYGLGRDKADDLQKTIDEVAAQTSIAREKIAQYGDQLQLAGARGENWKKALLGTAIVASATNDAQAGMFSSWAAHTALMGGSVDRLTNKMRDRYGNIVKQKMLDINVVALKQKEAIDSLFSGLKIDRFLSVWAQLQGMFSQTTAAGKALRAMLVPLFQPFVDGAERGVLAMKRFFQGMIIGALVVGIALRKLQNVWRKIFGTETQNDTRKWFDVFVYAGVVAFAAIGLALLGLAAVFAVIAVSVFALSLPFILMAAAIGLVLYGLYKIVDYLSGGLDFDAFVNLGRNMVDGIIDGIGNMFGPLGKAFAMLAHKAVGVFSDELDMHSPSKVFAALGEDISAGVALGVTRGAPEATSAVDSMASGLAPGVNLPPDVSMSDQPSGGGARGGSSVSIGELVVNAGPSGGSPNADAAVLAQAIKRELERVLAGLVVQTASGSAA